MKKILSGREKTLLSVLMNTECRTGLLGKEEEEGGGTETESLLTRLLGWGTEEEEGTKEGEEGEMKRGSEFKSGVEIE